MKGGFKMSFKATAIIVLLFFLMVPVFPAMGENFGAYSNEDLASMRGKMRDASAEERAAFRKEWHNRMQSMTFEERQKYNGRPANAHEGGYGMDQQRDNAGSGYKKNYRRRHGHSRGRF